MTRRPLVISLARTGTREFVRDLLAAWEGERPEVWGSAQFECMLPGQTRSVDTWSSGISALWRLPFGLPAFLTALRRTLRQGGHDVLLFPSFHPWHGPAARLARRYGVSSVMVVHDGWPHPGEHFPGRVILEDLVYRQADALVFLSRHAAHTFLERRFAPKVHRVLYHGPLRLPAAPSQTAPSDEEQLFRILFAGRLSHYKGVDLLAEALCTFRPQRPWAATVAGEPRGRFRMPDWRGLQVDVLAGRLDEIRLADLLHSHDVLVLPYREASQSGMLLLAAAAGIPVICTRVGGLPEQLPQDAVLWIEPDAGELGAALERLAADAELWGTLRARMLLAGAALSWRPFQRELEELFRELVSSQPSR
jgi:glycosyltransferase involved in cell wall biosynthesis